MVEVIFFKIWAYTIFFRDKILILRKKLVCPLVATVEKRNFCSNSTQKCSQVLKTLSYFPVIFSTVFDCFKLTVHNIDFYAQLNSLKA